MNEGVWVAIGAALGTIGAILTTWLAAHLDRKSKFPSYDRAVQPLLLEMLNGEHKWRKLEELSRVTGLTLQDTKDYLVELGARGSANNGELWGLISRNPISEAGKDDPKEED